MNTEEIIKRLKNPQQYRTTQTGASSMQQDASATRTTPAPVNRSATKTNLDLIVACSVVVLFFITLLFWVMSKKRAENLTAALTPGQIQGLSSEQAFNPNSIVTQVEIREGHDRNMAVSNLGSTLPVISRFNYQTLTEKNYEIIGAAPWALTTNFEANLTDPDLIRYLLGNQVMIEAFVNRSDVAPLLEDPQLLLAFTEDHATLSEFFNSQTVKAVLADPKMLQAVSNSRFMYRLLTSQSGQYFRTHPQEALTAIRNNPYLETLRQNPNVRIAIKENPYLKSFDGMLFPATNKQKPVASGTAARTSAKQRSPRRAKK